MAEGALNTQQDAPAESAPPNRIRQPAGIGRIAASFTCDQDTREWRGKLARVGDGGVCIARWRGVVGNVSVVT